MATWDDFSTLDIRVGEILEALPFSEARRPAYKLKIDFGEDIGLKQSSAQLTQCYQFSDLIGRQILAVINFPPIRIAGYLSEVLVLGTYSPQGVVLIIPEQTVSKGDKLG